MQILREYGSLPVLVDDQIDLRVELTRAIYAELVVGDAGSEAVEISKETLYPCDY